MSDEEILTAQQRADVAKFAGVSGEGISDEELLTEAADKIGLTGELAVDPDGVVELERGNILVVLEQVGEEDAELVDHPELLHLAVYVKPESDAERRELEDEDLLEPVPAGEELEEGWTFAWWGGMCTQLPREADLPTQMDALHRVMVEAERVLDERSLDGFFERMRWIDNEQEE